MSRGLSSYPVEKRTQIALRRLKNKTNGSGYWAAVDYLSKVDISKVPKEVLKKLTHEVIATGKVKVSK